MDKTVLINIQNEVLLLICAHTSMHVRDSNVAKLVEFQVERESTRTISTSRRTLSEDIRQPYLRQFRCKAWTAMETTRTYMTVALRVVGAGAVRRVYRGCRHFSLVGCSCLVHHDAGKSTMFIRRIT